MTMLILATALMQSALLSLQDLRYRRIYVLDALFLGAFLYLKGPTGQSTNELLSSFGAFALLILLKKGLEKKIKKPVFGLGDALILSLLLPFIPLESLPVYLCLSGVLGLSYALLRPKERQKIPLVFILLLSFWISQLTPLF